MSPAFSRHSLLWKGFQSSLWQVGLQYHTNLHLEQMSLAPEAPHVLQVPPFTDDMARGGLPVGVPADAQCG